MCGKSAFTLIELLAVVSIIALLAAILLPALSGIREKARQAVCISNLKQLSYAFYLYTQDYNERLPRKDRQSLGEYQAGCWFDVLTPYLDGKLYSSVKQCPSFRGDITKYRSYKINSRIDKQGGVAVDFPHSARIKNPDKTVLLFDGETDPWPYGGPHFDGLIGYLADPPRHNRGIDILFVGGNVGWFPAKDLQNWGTSNPESSVWWGE